MMACWRKQNTEEVIIITAGGGCYVSREEGWGEHQDGGGFFLFAYFALSALIIWARCFCKANTLIVCFQQLGQRGVIEYQRPFAFSVE